MQLIIALLFTFLFNTAGKANPAGHPLCGAPTKKGTCRVPVEGGGKCGNHAKPTERLNAQVRCGHIDGGIPCVRIAGREGLCGPHQREAEAFTEEILAVNVPIRSKIENNRPVRITKVEGGTITVTTKGESVRCTYEAAPGTGQCGRDRVNDLFCDVHEKDDPSKSILNYGKEVPVTEPVQEKKKGYRVCATEGCKNTAAKAHDMCYLHGAPRPEKKDEPKKATVTQTVEAVANLLFGMTVQQLIGKFATQDRVVLAGTGTRKIRVAEVAEQRRIFEITLDIVTKLYELFPQLVIMSGGAEGFDELLAKVGFRLGIPVVFALPNAGHPDYYWGLPNRRGKGGSLTGRDRRGEWAAMKAQAMATIDIRKDVLGWTKVVNGKTVPSDGLYALKENVPVNQRRECLENHDHRGTCEHLNFVRNDYMVNGRENSRFQGADLFLVLDPSGGGTGHCYGLIKAKGTPHQIIT